MRSSTWGNPYFHLGFNGLIESGHHHFFTTACCTSHHHGVVGDHESTFPKFLWHLAFCYWLPNPCYSICMRALLEFASVRFSAIFPNFMLIKIFFRLRYSPKILWRGGSGRVHLIVGLQTPYVQEPNWSLNKLYFLAHSSYLLDQQYHEKYFTPSSVSFYTWSNERLLYKYLSFNK